MQVETNLFTSILDPIEVIISKCSQVLDSSKREEAGHLSKYSVYSFTNLIINTGSSKGVVLLTTTSR